MLKIIGAALLAILLLGPNGASAAPKRSSNHWAGVSAQDQARSYARDDVSEQLGIANRAAWEARNFFYRGPTYVGRY